MKIGFVFLIMFFFTITYSKEPWSHLYKYILTKKDHALYKKKHYFVYRQTDTMPFTQLILTWNALRPEKGTFIFKVSVKNAQTNKWDTLHNVALWGKEQKSFFSKGVCSTFHYSRLEMEKNLLANGFEIHVEGDSDALINNLKALFVSICNQHEFISEPYELRAKGLSSCKVKRAVKKSQMMINHSRSNALCSPTSISMLVQTLQKKHVDPLKTAQYVYDPSLDIFGNWPFNMAHAFELASKRLFFYVMRPSSFKEIYERLKNNIPVAVSIRGPIRGGYTPYKNGHLLVVVGWDALNKKVICHDPASNEFEGVKVAYDLHDFIVAWERSRRLTYMPEFMRAS